MARLLSASGHRVVNDPGDVPRRFADMLVGEVGITLGRGGIGMTEQAPRRATTGADRRSIDDASVARAEPAAMGNRVGPDKPAPAPAALD